VGAAVNSVVNTAFRNAKTWHPRGLLVLNGNTEVLAGSYTKADGSTAQLGATSLVVSQQSSSLNLANNPFYSQFTDNPAPTAADERGRACARFALGHESGHGAIHRT
jgi:hypothetical protein